MYSFRWTVLYYGSERHRNEASIQSYSKTDISTKRKMSETLTEARGTECEVRINEAPLLPILNLSQEKVQVQNSQVTKNFNFFNCNVNIQ